MLATSETLDWKSLRFLNLYRLVVSGLLVTLISFPSFGGLNDLLAPNLFVLAALLYLVFSISISFSIRARALPRQVMFQAQVGVDLVVLALLAFASGASSTLFFSLMLVPVLFAGFWQPGLMTQFYAALAILAMLLVVALHHWWQGAPYSVVQLAILAVALLAVGLFSGLSGGQMAATRQQARARERELANLAELNAYIVQRVQEGALVVDAQDRIRFANPAACSLLGLAPNQVQERDLLLGQLSPALRELTHAWRRGIPLDSAATAPLRVQLTAYGSGREQSLLLLLEDTRKLDTRLQTEKMAALGRLTAGLAHEIRNPLGAIGHATQLLNEMREWNPQERKLLEILRNQVQRLDSLVDDILQLSRRKAADWQDLSLSRWLRLQLEEWRLTWPEAYAVLQLECEAEQEAMQVRVDPQQLRQLLTILIDNALRHARPVQDALHIALHLRRVGAAQTPCIEVRDNGPGIPLELQSQIYEPFFSTGHGGSGLGLYLARELCEANYCELGYQRLAAAVGDSGGSCFRISFPLERPVQQDDRS